MKFSTCIRVRVCIMWDWGLSFLLLLIWEIEAQWLGNLYKAQHEINTMVIIKITLMLFLKPLMEMTQLPQISSHFLVFSNPFIS